MNIPARSLAISLLCVWICQARLDPTVCGTDADRSLSEFHLHRKSARSLNRKITLNNATAVLPDNGQIALLDDTDGVVSRRNAFNLNQKTVRFLPTASGAGRYRFEVTGDSYDAGAATAGTLVGGIGDDDTRELSLPFSFPFFGAQYRKVSLNSDGNLTFSTGDAGSGTRSLGRVTAGPPRLVPLFDDLDPTQARDGIRVLSEPGRYVISWVQVPEFADFGTGVMETFQVRLFPDGKIEFAYSNVNVIEAVVGIAPGRVQGATSLVDFAAAITTANNQEFSAAVAERFTGTDEVDIFSAGQKFFLNHDDSYDYMVVYNALGIPASSGAVAYEVTVRNNRSGFGDAKVDLGFEAGSKRRLQAILNMGPLSQYPLDPNATVPARGPTGDTSLTVLGHETGHLFLAFASVRDPNDAEARPMLGQALVHWSFYFNSEASLLEGNRIQDDGEAASPRFRTTATVQGYAPLDQYLMGFLPPENVPDTFLVNRPGANAARAPQVGITFNGTRRNIHIDEIVQVEGRRIPDSTVSQRHFRFAFVLVTQNGVAPTADQLRQLDTYRSQFESFFNRASSQNATADTSLKKSLRVSTFPAAGIPVGGTANGTVSVESAVTAPVTVLLSQNGLLSAPASVTIPTGATQATFQFSGLREGVDELVARVNDQYETVNSRIQVAAAPNVKPVVDSGDHQISTSGVELAQPISIRVTDVNELPYPGVRVQATVSDGGALISPSAVTNENGVAQFRWKPGPSALNELRATLDNGASVVATAVGQPSFAAGSVVNAASFAPGISPGSIATIFGANLAGINPGDAQVLVNGTAAQVFYADNRQVNFLVPASLTGTSAGVVAKTSVGSSASANVPMTATAPGIFFDAATGFGAILVTGRKSSSPWFDTVPMRGDYVEIYSTGLGPVQDLTGGLQQTVASPQVLIGGLPAKVLFSGLAPGFPGLYQVNAQIPDGVASGVGRVSLSVNGSSSNQVKISIQ